MKIAIHQPNFCPWEPYFDKMRQADVFVILTYCQFEKNNYQNRFFHNGWSTMSVNKGLEPIRDKTYMNAVNDWRKITGKYPSLKKFDDLLSSNLWVFNSSIIMRTAKILGIKTKIEFDTPTDLRGDDRLIDICKGYKAVEYISGPSGPKYMDLTKFAQAGIKVTVTEPKEKRSLWEMI